MKLARLSGVQDPRSYRGIFSRGHAKYAGPSNSPKPGNMTNVQKAAKRRLAKLADKRRFR